MLTRIRTRDNEIFGRDSFIGASTLLWLRQLQLRIADLPDEIQSILRLRFYGEAGFRQIAEILALPEGTVKTKYYTTIRMLREEANRQ